MTLREMKIFVYLWYNDLFVYFIWVLSRFSLSHLASYEDINIKFTSVLAYNSVYTPLEFIFCTVEEDSCAIAFICQRTTFLEA